MIVSSCLTKYRFHFLPRSPVLRVSTLIRRCVLSLVQLILYVSLGRLQISCFTCLSTMLVFLSPLAPAFAFVHCFLRALTWLLFSLRLTLISLSELFLMDHLAVNWLPPWSRGFRGFYPFDFWPHVHVLLLFPYLGHIRHCVSSVMNKLVWNLSWLPTHALRLFTVKTETCISTWIRLTGWRYERGSQPK